MIFHVFYQLYFPDSNDRNVFRTNVPTGKRLQILVSKVLSRFVRDYFYQMIRTWHIRLLYQMQLVDERKTLWFYNDTQSVTHGYTSRMLLLGPVLEIARRDDLRTTMLSNDFLNSYTTYLGESHLRMWTKEGLRRVTWKTYVTKTKHRKVISFNTGIYFVVIHLRTLRTISLWLEPYHNLRRFCLSK